MHHYHLPLLLLFRIGSRLKCHVPERPALEDRFAALKTSMPVKAAPLPAKP